MRTPRQIYIEINPDTDQVEQIHWTRDSAIAKYSRATMTRVDRILGRVHGCGFLVKGNVWAKIPYRKGIGFYEIERRAVDQTRDLKLRYLFNKHKQTNLKSKISKDNINYLIEKISIYLK